MTGLTGKTLLNRYRLDAFLGRGGMAEVYKAWDEKRSVYVAIKLLNEGVAAYGSSLISLEQEADTLRALRHPHIVRFFDFERWHDRTFLVMEYVSGMTLKRYLERLGRQLSVPEALCIVRPVSRALHYAHQMGVFHCDVKPANILIKRGDEVVLSDFGVAHLAGAAVDRPSAAGTPAYQSPEQCLHALPDARTDVYSLGVTAFEILTRTRPFKEDPAAEGVTTGERIRWQHVHSPPPLPRRWNPNLPVAAEAAILKALEKDPQRRQQDPLAFAWELSGRGQVKEAEGLPPLTAPISESAAAHGEEKRVSTPSARAALTETIRRLWSGASRIQRSLALAIVAAFFVFLLALALVGLSNERHPPSLEIRRWAAQSMNEFCNGRPFGSLILTVETVDVLDSGGLRFNVSWLWKVTDAERSNCPSGSPVVYSDLGNTNMYISDGLGRRYDHVEVGGGAEVDDSGLIIHGIELGEAARE
jgi:serine/threonine protein kinase